MTVTVGTKLVLSPLKNARCFPEKVCVVGVKDGKVWLTDYPRTMHMPRYLRETEIFEYYKEELHP